MHGEALFINKKTVDEFGPFFYEVAKELRIFVPIRRNPTVSDRIMFGMNQRPKNAEIRISRH